MSILNVNKINPVGGGSTITIAGIASVTNNISVGNSVTASSFHGNLTGDVTGDVTGSGANLTNLPAANLTGTLPAISGANLTGITAGITMVDMWRLNANYNIPHNSTAVISTANWERPDTTNDAFGQLGTGMTVNAGAHAAGVWPFPSTGFYMVTCGAEVFSSSANGTVVTVRMEATEDGASFGLQTWFRVSGPQNYWRSGYGNAIMDVTNTSNVKFRLRIYSDATGQVLYGNTNENHTYLSFNRLADT